MINFFKKNQGQSIIEVVFLVGALSVVLTGAVILLLNSVNSRTKGFDRKKATELSEYVIESMVNLKENNPTTFWGQTGTNLTAQANSSYPGYTYDVVYTDAKSTYTCTRRCVEVGVTVRWVRNANESISFSRLFSEQ